jgi:PTS system, lactose/cellobiose family IIC component
MSSLQEKIITIAGKIQTNRYISTITSALMSAMPVTIIGGMGSLLNALPVPAYQDFLVANNLKVITAIPTELTTNLLSLYVVFLIAYKFCESYDIDGTIAGLLSLMTFMFVTPFAYSETNTMAALNIRWFGATGLFTAFIIGLLVGKIYSTFIVKGWIIKMPPGVPTTVSKSFSGLIPGFLVAIIGLIIRGVMAATPFGDMHTMIFQLVAAPLTKLGNTFPAFLFAVLIGQILWSLGIHGTMVVYSVFAAMWTPLSMENLAAFSAGLPIPHLITGSLFGQCVAMGSGQTLGLVIAMLVGKSEQFKTIGKLSLIPNICGINEPVIFGSPVVMNIKLIPPFILAPLATLISAYVGMRLGLLPYLPGISIPLGVPIVMNGFLAGGIPWMIFQILMIGVSFLIYYPFFKAVDKESYANEQLAKAEVK